MSKGPGANFTPERRRVLTLCRDAPAPGHRPIGFDWQAIYWLLDHKLVARTRVTRQVSRFKATEHGETLLAAMPATGSRAP